MTSGKRERRWSLDDAAKALGMDRDALFEWLRQQRYAYRYTGVGKKLAYVRWVRFGFFENEPMGMMITVRGMRMIRRDIHRSPLALNGTTKP
jgi:hypothetical protein